jgi:hypothetical protein
MEKAGDRETFFDANAALVFAACRGHQKNFVHDWPHLSLLSCFFLDAIKEIYNKPHIISFHQENTPPLPS